MAELTEKQRRFIAKYLTGGAPRDQGGERADASLLLQGISKIKVPPGATPEETQAITGPLAAAQALLDAEPTPAELRAAGEEVKRALQAQADCRARLAMVEQAAALKQRIAELDAGRDADGSEQTAGTVKKLVDGLNAALGQPNSAVLEQVKAGIARLEQFARTLAEEGTAVRTSRGERIGQISSDATSALQGIDVDATAEERQLVAGVPAEIAKLGAGDQTTAKALADAEGALTGLKHTLGEIAQRHELDRDRRTQARKGLADRAAKSPPARATDPEKLALSQLLASVGQLSPCPTDEALSAAEKTVADFESRVLALEQAVQQREVRFEQAKGKLARLAPAAPGLAPHDKVPKAAAEAIAKDAAAALQAAAKFGEWAQVTTWADEDLVGLEQTIAGLEKRATDLRELTGKRVLAVDQARTAAQSAVGTAKGRALSKTQKEAFELRITAQAERFAQDSETADEVVAALGTVGADAVKLSAALALLERRLTAVVAPASAGLAKTELEAIDKAKKAALAALDAVTEP